MDICEARAGEYAHLRIAMGWGGALVGCGSCSSRVVTATVQMRSAGSVRFMRPTGVIRALLRDVVVGEIRVGRNLD
jgi:hypothetical protein